MVATSSSSTYLLGSDPVTIAVGVTINPLSSYAVSGGAGSILTNYGVLSSHGAAGVDVGAGSTVTNSGAIASALGAGIVLGASSMLTNGASGSIASATNVGVSIGSGSTVTNAGLIDAISFGGSGTFNNESGGRITVSGAAPQTPVVAYAGLLLVQNAGTISATGVDAQGVALYDGGGVTNLTGGTISASGSNDQGIFLGDGGVVQNAAGGLITSEFAPIYIAGGSATILNSGTIDGSGGITAVIPTLHHLHSVSAAAASTVVNAGTIDGAGGDAISLLSGFSNRVVADPGAVFVGTVNGGGTLSTLELAPGASVGTLNGIGSQFVGFGTLQFDSGADWTVSASSMGLPGLIEGFAPGDTIDLTGVTLTSAVFAGGILTLSGGGVGNTATLDLAGVVGSTDFVLTPVAGGTDISLPFALAIGGTVPYQPVSDLGTIAPLSGVTIGDPNLDQTETVTVQLSAPGDFTLSDLGSGSFNAMTGIFVDTGSAATVTADLNGLVFTPAVSPSAAGTAIASTVTITVTDTADDTASAATTIAITAPPVVVNGSGDTSYDFVYNPGSTVTETVATYSGPGLTGTIISDVVDNANGTSLLYAYDPSSGVRETASLYSGTDAANGAPSGPQISEVVDNSDGTSLVYAYDPTSGVSQTTQTWSATNPSNGAPAGQEISDVVDNSDGTSLVYVYNPSASVTESVAAYSATNPVNGAPAGNEISAVVDDNDGTSILYSFNPSAGLTGTASYYSATDAATGAPTGMLTSETFDLVDGQSAITSYGVNGPGSTTYFSGLNGSGTALGIGPSLNGSVVAITGTGLVVDAGTGNQIQFAAGATGDTVVLPSSGSVQIYGFSPSAGDLLDFAALLSSANVSIGDLSQLANYVTVVNVNGSASVLFDPAGHNGGSQVAVLVNGGGLVSQLQTLQSFVI